MMSVKVLLNRGTLAATLMTMVLFAAMPTQAQTTLVAAYDFARLKNDGGNMHGLAVTGDMVIWGEYLTVTGTVSRTMGKIEVPVWGGGTKENSTSRLYIGVGPGVRFDIGKVQVFGHVFLGALVAGVESDLASVNRITRGVTASATVGVSRSRSPTEVLCTSAWTTTG